LPLADADAQRGEAVAAPAPAQLVQERDDEPRTAHAERMAERDRAAVDVHLVAGEAELADPFSDPPSSAFFNSAR